MEKTLNIIVSILIIVILATVVYYANIFGVQTTIEKFSEKLDKQIQEKAEENNIIECPDEVNGDKVLMYEICSQEINKAKGYLN